VREDVADLTALVEHLGLYPAHLAGNSFGGTIVLRLAGERPDLFKSLMVHEPPVFELLADQSDTQPMLAEIRRRAGAVIERLKVGDNAGSARLFVETIAFGPGAWEQLPATLQQTFIFNAPTWLDETQDPESLTLDLARLSTFPCSALLTHGDQSAPFFPLVVAKVASVFGRGEQKIFRGAGHVPHLSHPQEYVKVVKEFAERASR
jgi:pimeloyl-ACP methyl ester carboxylesterase